MSDIKFGSAFFCEDVRTEASGKLIFVGTYTGTLHSTIKPGNLALYLVTIFRGGPGTEKVQLGIDFGTKRLADADFEVTADDEGNTFCVFPPLAFEDVTETTPIDILLRIGSGEWEKVYSSTFEISENAVDQN